MENKLIKFTPFQYPVIVSKKDHASTKAIAANLNKTHRFDLAPINFHESQRGLSQPGSLGYICDSAGSDRLMK